MSDDLSQYWYAEKELSLIPIWESREKDEFVRLFSPLDIDGVTIQGLRFTASAHVPTPDKWVTFQIELESLKHPRGVPMVRFEWRARSPHNNKGAGPEEYRFQNINGTHLHPFELNWEHSNAQVRKGNLPIAIPVADEMETYQAALDFVEKTFRIKGVSRLGAPPWSGLIL